MTTFAARWWAIGFLPAFFVNCVRWHNRIPTGTVLWTVAIGITSALVGLSLIAIRKGGHRA